MKLYALAVLALATLGCESHPKVKWAPGEAAGAPSTPVGVTLTPDHESVTVRWTANPADELVSSLQGGTPGNDQGFGVSAGKTGDLYAVGYTDDALDGEGPLGVADAFVVHYRLSGERMWTRLLGTPGNDFANAAAVDAAGNLLVVGYTNGAFPTFPAQGQDAFLAKFASDGTLAWVRQIGSPGNDFANAVAVVGSNSICVAGTTDGDLDGENNAGMNDAFVTLYDAGGTRQWTRLVGTTVVEIGAAVAMRSAGTCYVAGYTTGALSGSNLGGNDAFVAEYIAGGQTWIRQFGSGASDTVGSVVADDARDRVYVAGLTSGSFGGETLSGASDPFVVAYDRSGGAIDWTTFIGGSSGENTARLALQADGRPVASFYAFQPVSSADVFVAQLTTAGVVDWSTPVATGDLDYLGGISTDDYGNAYVSGYTYGAIGAPNAGLWDHFVAKIGPTGEVR